MRGWTWAAAVLGVAGLAWTVPASAQVEFGVRAGLSVSDLEFDSPEVGDLDRRTGVMAGVFAEVPLTGSFSLQPGLAYVQKGGEAESGGVTAGLHLGYMEMPILLKYSFPMGGELGLHVQAGPTVALEVSCKNVAAAGEFDSTIDCDQGGVSQDHVETNAFDFGGVVGGGVSVPLGDRRQLLIEVAYDHGFADIWGEEDVAKNRALFLTAGIRFATGR